MNGKLMAFGIGQHRPVYLWAGPGTIRMNRLKFMDAPVDEAVHFEAHTPIGARRMAEEANFNWAYLAYNWGFPPEVEQEDWQAFREAVPIYHAAGLRVFGYIQTSNCVYDGSYLERDWYALDPHGRPFYYYTGRYMTCWLHPEWRQHLRDMVQEVIESDADGVFFDNPWHASQPFLLCGAWLGSAGCYCGRCRDAFRAATGSEIPALISPDIDQVSCRYLRWRADLVTRTLSELASHARFLNADVVVSANNFDAVMRPSFAAFGIDLPALAQVQDVLMIEDYGLARWEASAQHAKAASREYAAGLLINNALTLHTAVALARGTPVTTDPYDKGIGFDAVYAPRRFQQGIAEAAACGAPMVVKGTEFVEDAHFTLLSAEQYAPQRLAIGRYHRWLQENADLYAKRVNLAPVGLLYPGEALWQNWAQLAAGYFGAGQTLTAAGIPWRVVAAAEDLSGLWTLLSLGPLPDGLAAPPDLRIVDLPTLPGWELPPRSWLSRQVGLRRVLSFFVGEIYRSYFRFRWARWLLDHIGMVHFFLQSPYFRMPPPVAQRALLDALGQGPWPRLEKEAPVLIECWAQGATQQIHLVNYDQQRQTVRLHFGEEVAGRVLSPDGPDFQFRAAAISFSLDIHSVIEIQPNT